MDPPTLPVRGYPPHPLLPMTPTAWTKCGQTHQGCAAHKKRVRPFTPCAAAPIKGGTVCHHHGGRAVQVRDAADRNLLERQVRAEADRLGVPIEVDPAEALLALIYEAAGNVTFYRAQVAQLEAEEGRLYVALHHESGVPSGEAKPHVLVRMYDAERDRLAGLIANALKLGLDERRVRLAEADASRLFGVIITAIADAGLTPDQGDGLRRAIAARLRAS